jgi:HK97 family phage major capsid protein
MATESEEAKKIEDLGKDLFKSIKGLEEKIKEQGDVRDLLKGMQDQFDTLKDNPDKIKGLTERVEEVIVKLNRPEYQKGADESFKSELAKTLEEKLKGTSFTAKGDNVKIGMVKGQDGITKAAATITGANLTEGGVATSANPEVRQNVLLGPQRKIHMRNILAMSPMSTDLIKYPQHVASEGDFEIQANQGDKKAQLDEKFEMMSAEAFTIAGFYRVAKQAIADIPWLTNAILSKGTERFLKAEDRKILYGLGGANDIKGIKASAPAFTGDMPNMYEAILNAVTALQDADYDPNGTLLRPMNYAELLKYKTTTGEYNSPMLFMPNQQFPMSVAGVPLMMSTAVTLNDAFVGDWAAENLRMLIREGLTIDFAYEDEDNFQRNLVTIRLEAREGLEIDEPNAFRYLNLALIAPTV